MPDRKITSRERAEKIADKQLSTWNWRTEPKLRLLRQAIRADMLIPAIEQALIEAAAEERNACVEVARKTTNEMLEKSFTEKGEISRNIWKWCAEGAATVGQNIRERWRTK